MAMTLENITFNMGGPSVRYEMLEGRRHLVVPAVMITEGVLPGSEGPGLYLSEDFGKNINAWNHKPAVINHPVSNGRGVTACDPVVLNERKVGVILNTTTDGRLKTETWIDEDRLIKVDARVYNRLKEGKMVEVSTGLYVDKEFKDGTHNGKEYKWIARNYRPDHLAILPDDKGACSIDDGAGLLRNQSGEIDFGVDGLALGTSEGAQVYNKYYSRKKRRSMNTRDFGDPHRRAYPVKDQEDLDNAARLIGHAKDPAAVKSRLKRIAKSKGLKLPDAWASKPTHNSDPYKDKSQKQGGTATGEPLPVEGSQNQWSHTRIGNTLQQKLGDKFGGDFDGWVSDVFDNFFVYHTDGKLMRLPYDYKENKSDLMIDDKAAPEQVQRVTEYRTMQGAYVGNLAEVLIHNEVKPMEKKQKIDLLIKNGLWKEDQRNWLTSLEDHVLDTLPGMDKVNVEGAKQDANGNPQITKTGLPDGPAMNLDSYIKQAPPDVQDLLTDALAARREQKQSLVTNIMANPNNSFTKEWLEGQTVPMLTGLAKLSVTQTTQPVINYGTQGGQGPPMFQTHQINVNGNPNVETPKPMGKLPNIDYTEDRKQMEVVTNRTLARRS